MKPYAQAAHRKGVHEVLERVRGTQRHMEPGKAKHRLTHRTIDKWADEIDLKFLSFRYNQA